MKRNKKKYSVIAGCSLLIAVTVCLTGCGGNSIMETETESPSVELKASVNDLKKNTITKLSEEPTDNEDIAEVMSTEGTELVTAIPEEPATEMLDTDPNRIDVGDFSVIVPEGWEYTRTPEGGLTGDPNVYRTNDIAITKCSDEEYLKKWEKSMGINLMTGSYPEAYVDYIQSWLNTFPDVQWSTEYFLGYEAIYGRGHVDFTNVDGSDVEFNHEFMAIPLDEYTYIFISHRCYDCPLNFSILDWDSRNIINSIEFHF